MWLITSVFRSSVLFQAISAPPYNIHGESNSSLITTTVMTNYKGPNIVIATNIALQTNNTLRIFVHSLQSSSY